MAYGTVSPFLEVFWGVALSNDLNYLFFYPIFIFWIVKDRLLFIDN